MDLFVQRHWSRAGDPIRKDSRWVKSTPVVVFGVISPTLGVVHMHYSEHSFTSEDIGEALKEVRLKIGQGPKLAMGWDNANIHRAKYIKGLLTTPEVDMEPIWNVAARPDLLTLGQE